MLKNQLYMAVKHVGAGEISEILLAELLIQVQVYLQVLQNLRLQVHQQAHQLRQTRQQVQARVHIYQKAKVQKHHKKLRHQLKQANG